MMSEPVSSSVSAKLVAAWRERLVNLERTVAAEPSGEWAWLWRIRIDILRFLLSRYDSEHADHPVGARDDSAASPSSVEASTVFDSPRSFAEAPLPIPSDPSSGAFAHLGAPVGERLRSIQAANAERHRAAQVERDAFERELQRMQQEWEMGLQRLKEAIGRYRSEPDSESRARLISNLPPDEQVLLLAYARSTGEDLSPHFDSPTMRAAAKPMLSEDEIADILSEKKPQLPHEESA